MMIYIQQYIIITLNKLAKPVE